MLHYNQCSIPNAVGNMSSIDNATLVVPTSLSHAERKVTRSGTLVHANNFDAIRLVAALLVLVSHQLFFLGKTQPLVAGRTLGDLGIFVFFIISGYLVAESWCRDPHFVRFAMRRFLRIWPALAAATVIIALVGALVTTLSPSEYFHSDTLRFITHNLQLRIAYDLPGVFTSSPSGAMSAVNGSWWSIPLEMKCYLYLALLGLVGLRRRWLVVFALMLVVIWYIRTLPGHPKANALHNLRYLCIAFFMTGICARQFMDVLLRFRIAWLCVGVLLFIAAVASGTGDLALWVVLAPLVLVAGSLSTPWVRAASRFGDLSYGIYIYAYFVQQLSVRYWPGPQSLVASTCVSAVIAAALAWCSWHAVEAPALGLKRKLRTWFPDGAA